MSGEGRGGEGGRREGRDGDKGNKTCIETRRVFKAKLEANTRYCIVLAHEAITNYFEAVHINANFKIYQYETAYLVC